VHNRFVYGPVSAPKSLAARGGLTRTFGGLAAFAAVTLLTAGLYILQDAFANPISGTAAAVIVAAFMIAVAAILLFFLLKPRKGPRSEHLVKTRSPSSGFLPSPTHAHNPARQNHSSNNLPYQRVYVDHSLIRP